MEDLGFNGSGSRFNSRFEAGSPIQAKQLNDLAAGVQASLPMPYLGDGASVSFTPGGAVITTTPSVFTKGAGGGTYYNQFQCVVTEEEDEDGDLAWYLQIVKGSVVYGNDKQATQVGIDAATPGSPATVTVVEGDDPDSIFTEKGGYYILGEDVSWSVYLVHIKVTETDKHFTYLYIADQDTYNYPSNNFVAYGVDDTPPGLDTPETAYTMSVVQIAQIIWDATDKAYTLSQELIGTQSLPTITPPIQFAVDVINREKDITKQPDWLLRVAKGVVLYPPDLPGGCANVQWVDEVSPIVGPVIGDYQDSPYTNRGGGVNVTRTLDYDVYLFLVREEAGSGVNPVLWVGPTANYEDKCPVELPEDIRPPGPYTAQSVHIAFVEQKDTTSNTWVVNQIVQGTVTVPDDGEADRHPFFIYFRPGNDGAFDWSYKVGSVNNVMLPPDEGPWSTDTGDGYIVLRAQYVEPDYPQNPDGVSINFFATIPPDTDEFGRIALAQITGGGKKINQLVTGSLWSNRIKLGLNTARYFWARI
jgi:hypothetical protein